MRTITKSIGTIALALAAALFSSGCPALIVPSLAYQGYKYKHNQNESAPSTQSDKSTAPADRKALDAADIE